MRSNTIHIAVALTALALGACAAPTSGDDQERIDSDAEELLQTGLKAKLRGVVLTSGSFPSETSLSFIQSAVFKIDWSQIEKSDQQFDWSRIDQAVANARSRGAALRLRIMAGNAAPAFVKAIGGFKVSDPDHRIDCSAGGIAIYNKWDGVGGCTSAFWLPRVIDQYEQLMAAVAARYDGTPEIRDVVDSGCMTTYAEPFYRAHAEPASNARLWNAGLDFTKDKACHTRAVQIHAKYFVHTRTSLAINAWDVIDGSTDHWSPSTAPTLAFVDEVAIPTLGKRLVLQNNSLSESDGCPAGGTEATNYPYCQIAQYAGPKGFQTETFVRLGGTGSAPAATFADSANGLYSALGHADQMGANFVELSGLGHDALIQLDAAKLHSYDSALRANP